MAEKVQKKPPASGEEEERREAVIAALGRLSDDDTRKLRKYAAYKGVGMRGTVFHADADDLLHDAIERTLDGRRKWNPEKVDLTTHLMGCMRSIASQFRENAEREFLHRQAEQHKDVASTSAGSQPEKALERINAATLARETLDRIRENLKDDKVALPIFDRLREGYTPAEIREVLGIDSGIFDAARKRIYRCIKALI